MQNSVLITQNLKTQLKERTIIVMPPANKKLVTVSICLSLMIFITICAYLFSKNMDAYTKAGLTTKPAEFVIATANNTGACFSTKSNEIIWNCAESKCTETEVQSCITNGNHYTDLQNNDLLLSSVTTESTIASPMVAGANTNTCPLASSGVLPQNGCVSGQMISVIGPPKTFTKTKAIIRESGVFSKTASYDLTDTTRVYLSTNREPVRFAIKLKNNGRDKVNDTYDFLVSKVIEAPLGTTVTGSTSLCDAQLQQLDRTLQIKEISRFVKLDQPYLINVNEVKMLTGEWTPSSTDCGLYKIELAADTFSDEVSKQCPVQPITSNNVVARAFVRVVGSACGSVKGLNTVSSACTYAPFSDWVEQSRDKNTSVRLKTFALPDQNLKHKVKVKYEYAPVGDKTSQTSPNCGPQANEEAAIQVVGENFVNKLYFGGYRFEDNAYADTKQDSIANNYPDTVASKEMELNLPPGAYSIMSNWQGDGQDFWNMPISGKKYYLDVRNKAKGMIPYELARADKDQYGDDCKWAGSYKIRASYCVAGNLGNTSSQMQNLTLVLKNNNVATGTFRGNVTINGVELGQTNGDTTMVLAPGEVKTFEFVYSNQFPSAAVLEINQETGSDTNTSLVKAIITNTNENSKPLFTYNTLRRITLEGIRFKFPQEN